MTQQLVRSAGSSLRWGLRSARSRTSKCARSRARYRLDLSSAERPAGAPSRWATPASRRLGSVLAAVAFGLAACAGSATTPPASTAPTASAPPIQEPTASSAAASAATGSCPTSQPAALATGQTRTVTIETPKGSIVIKVEGALSPIAAGNFVALASCGYYDGVVFHRVVKGFVIQGGDGQFGRGPNLDMSQIGNGGPGYTIKDEPVTAKYARGVVAMARTPQPDSQGSQFFIVLDDAAEQALASANTYAIFGHVTSGMDAVDAIAAAADAEIPSQPVPMSKVTVSNP